MKVRIVLLFALCGTSVPALAQSTTQVVPASPSESPVSTNSASDDHSDPSIMPPPVLTPTQGSAGSQILHAETGGKLPPGTVHTFQTPFPSNAMGYGLRLGDYYISRWVEDWSWLANKPRNYKPDPFDPLKFISIAGPGADGIYLTLSNEERFRYEHYSSPGLHSGPDRNMLLMRSILGGDLHFGQHFRVYGELNTSQQFGYNIGTVSPIQRNDAVVQQLFGEVKGNIGGVQVGAMFGRMELQDGPISIITLRPDNNVYVAMNGVRLYANAKFGRIAAFSYRSTNFQTGSFDDPVLSAERFKGITTSIKLTPGKQASLFFDPFVYNYRNDAKRWGTVTGRENRNFYGARLWGSLGKLVLDVSAMHQGGDFAGRPISANGAFSNVEYIVSNTGWKPRIGFHADFASGGGAFANGKLHTFNFIFGSTPYISWGHFVVTENLFDIAPRVRISPLPRLTLTGEAEFLRRPDQHDAVYSNTAAYAGTQSVRGRDIGTLFRADARYAVSHHLGVSLLFERLQAGHVLKAAKYDDATFTGIATSFYF